MADHSTIPIAITYHKPGTEPPLFVAGSFSAWEPQEMDCTTDEDGKHVFVKTVRVPPGTQIQYKFRVGQGDWWVLNDEAPTATDDAGNLNNIMTAPGPESSLKPKPLAHLQEAERQRLSSTPIGQVADTAAEVADTAEKLDGDKPDDTVPETPSKPQNPESVPVLVTQADEDEDEGPPLFSHEALGAVDFGDDDEPSRSPLVEQEERSHHGSVDYDLDKYDLNDPTLERWPSNDRRSIYDAVRKVETGTNEDQTFFLGSPVSPLVGARRLSMDDEAIDTSAPASPLLAKKLDVPRKKSHSSVVSNKSHTSLAAIVEEGGRQRAPAPEADETATAEDRKTGPPAISVPNPSTQAPEAHRSPASDDDEGVALRSSRKPAPAPATDADANPAPRHAQVCADPDSRAPPRPSSADPSDSPRPPLPAETGPNQSEAQAGALPDEMDELDDTDEDEAPVTDGRVQRREGSDNKDVTRGRWLPVFFRVLFYEWIGGFFGRLFRGQGKSSD